MSNRRSWGVLALLALGGTAPTAARADFYAQTNLVSDVPGLAPNTDPNLKNPWGVSFGPGGPFWVSNQVTGTATIYKGDGSPLGLVVTIPTKSSNPPTGPTGQVFNNTSDFALTSGGKALFIFANLDGTISGWNGAQGTSAELHVLPSSPTVYTGLALGQDGGNNFLYAADARGGKIDVFNGMFGHATLGGSFVDPTLPGGFSPYNVQNVNGTIYVTYSSAGGGGVVDAFTSDGAFLRRIGANDASGPLQTPWGVVLAPSGFGKFGGDLLIGNKGDGRITAFDPLGGGALGQLLDAGGNPITNGNLWALNFGGGGIGGDPGKLYFSAGINGEADGLFGSISAVPEPSSYALMGAGGLIGYLIFRRRSASRTAA